MKLFDKIKKFFKSEKKNSKLIATEELVSKNMKENPLLDSKLFKSAEKDLKKSIKESKKIESKSISDRGKLSDLASSAILNTFNTHKK